MLITLFEFNKIKHITLLVLISLGLLIIHSHVLAASPYLHDYANIISPQSTKKINTFLSEVEKKHALRIEEVILKDFDQKKDKNKIISVLENLNQEAPDKEKIILLVIVLNNNSIMLYTSPSLSSKFNNEVQKHLQKKIIKNIKLKNYDKMAENAAVELYRYYETTPPNSKKALFNIIFFIVMLIIVTAVIVKFRKQ